MSAGRSLTAQEAGVLRTLNAAVLASGDALEGNYGFFHRTRINRYVPLDARRSWKREFLRRAVVGARHLAEIGLNAGHSATLALSQSSSSHLTAVDLAATRYVASCAEVVAAAFPGRFRFIAGDSRQVLRPPGLLASDFDFVHIDGGHGTEVFLHDLQWFVHGARRGARVLVDDAYAAGIRGGLEAVVQLGALREVQPNFVSSGENRLYVKC